MMVEKLVAIFCILLHVRFCEAAVDFRVRSVTFKSAVVEWRPLGPLLSPRYSLVLRRYQNENDNIKVDVQCQRNNHVCVHTLQDLLPSSKYWVLLTQVVNHHTTSSRWQSFETKPEPVTRETLPPPSNLLFFPFNQTVSFILTKFSFRLVCAKVVDHITSEAYNIVDDGTCLQNDTIEVPYTEGLGIVLCSLDNPEECGPPGMARIYSRSASGWFSWPPWAYLLVIFLLFLGTLPFCVPFLWKKVRKRYRSKSPSNSGSSSFALLQSRPPQAVPTAPPVENEENIENTVREEQSLITSTRVRAPPPPYQPPSQPPPRPPPPYDLHPQGSASKINLNVNINL